jgi:hypothetical protein
MNVLVACEFSGVVREAFRRRGHNAWSCDLLPAADASPYHLQRDVRSVVTDRPHLLGYPFDRMVGGWDLMIAHPPCTYLCNSGVRWLYQQGTRVRIEARWQALDEAVKFAGFLWSAPILRVCLENPIMHGHARQRFGFDPTQIVQPWQFGHPETKATCLWLRGLEKLEPTHIVTGRIPRVHHESPGPDRWKRRSATYPGLAEAMAARWGA